MSSKTRTALRKLKDAEGRYILNDLPCGLFDPREEFILNIEDGNRLCPIQSGLNLNRRCSSATADNGDLLSLYFHPVITKIVIKSDARDDFGRFCRGS